MNMCKVILNADEKYIVHKDDRDDFDVQNDDQGKIISVKKGGEMMKRGV